MAKRRISRPSAAGARGAIFHIPVKRRQRAFGAGCSRKYDYAQIDTAALERLQQFANALRLSVQVEDTYTVAGIGDDNQLGAPGQRWDLQTGGGQDQAQSTEAVQQQAQPD